MGTRASTGGGGFLIAIAATVAIVQFGLPALAARLEDSERTSLPSDAPAGVVEGYDYSFIGEVLDKPVRWSCSTPVYVALRGNTPAGADAALKDAVDLIAEASGLPLQVGEADSSMPDITVSYDDAATSSDPIEDHLGEAMPRWDAITGRIAAASISIRADSDAGDPSSQAGIQVLLHELAHAVGLGHAVQGSDELMQPKYDPARDIGFGPGDSWALQVVGCAQQARYWKGGEPDE